MFVINRYAFLAVSLASIVQVIPTRIGFKLDDAYDGVSMNLTSLSWINIIVLIQFHSRMLF